jgi:regulator of sirC expression with transglutaminase-like and TPR domain
METQSQLAAALSLLDDPDPTVQRSVREHLAQTPEQSIPALRQVIRQGDDPDVNDAAQAVLRRIGTGRFVAEIRNVAEHADGDIDLEAGAFAIAFLGYPELVVEDYYQQLDTMATMLYPRMRRIGGGVNLVGEMSRYLSEELGFRGCEQEDYHNPENSFMNRVIDRRVGIPITLSITYLMLARRLGVSLYGVGFPFHYLLRFEGDRQEFYVDPFYDGRFLSREDCLRALEKMGMDTDGDPLTPLSNRATIQRMMHNLVEIYRGTDSEVTSALQEASDLL